MTQPKTSPTPNNAPAYIAWTVTAKGERNIWHRIGASWPHKDGRGFTLQLEATPLDGRIVLRAPGQTPDRPAEDGEGRR